MGRETTRGKKRLGVCAYSLLVSEHKLGAIIGTLRLETLIVLVESSIEEICMILVVEIPYVARCNTGTAKDVKITSKQPCTRYMKKTFLYRSTSVVLGYIISFSICAQKKNLYDQSPQKSH